MPTKLEFSHPFKIFETDRKAAKKLQMHPLLLFCVLSSILLPLIFELSQFMKVTSHR